MTFLRGSKSCGEEDRQIGVDARRPARRQRRRAAARRGRCRSSSLRRTAPRRRPIASDGSSGPSTSSASMRARSSFGSTPSARDSSSIACATPPALAIHAVTSSRRAISSRTTSRNVMSAADAIAVASAPASGVPGVLRGLEQHAHGGAVEQLVLGALVEHREARRHVGLERELMQQPGAERVDGLHLEAARRVERRGEQAARAGALRRADRGLADRAHLAVERVVVERDPVRERVEHARRHVGGRRLGEGDAQDLHRIGAGEQQPDHPLRQHVGLAGARIGRHEGRDLRIGGLGLARCAPASGMARALIRSTSSSASPPADHSLTRARSS